jgi:hypothetical protein
MNDYRSDGTLPGHHAKPEVTDQTTLARAAQRGAAERGDHPQSDHRALPSVEHTLERKMAALGGAEDDDHVGRLATLEKQVALLTSELHALVHRLRSSAYLPAGL